MKKNLLYTDRITIYLLNNSGKEKEMIDKIIQDDEKSRQEFDAYLNVWEKSADLKDFETIDAQADWKKVRSRMKMRSSIKKLPVQGYFLRIAAVLLLAVGLTYLLLRVIHLKPLEPITYSQITTTNNIQKVELPDGSIVHLNKSSKIIHNSDFTKFNRDIILEGEAFFNVSRNENLPFKIHCLNSTIEVLGTSFAVKVDTTQITVGVLTGKVVLYVNEESDKRIELLPENTGIYTTTNNDLNLKKYFDRNSIAWHTQEFVFRNQPLQEVCQVLADFYHLELRIDKDVQFTESITLTPSTESLDSILYTINSSLAENIRLIAKDNLLIVKKQ